jgi:hypothetical protein
MPEMKAMEFTDKLNLQPVTRPVPEPKAGEILIQVYATGGTPTEKLWYTTSHYADGSTRSKAIPGHEFSGIVAGLAILADEKCRQTAGKIAYISSRETNYQGDNSYETNMARPFRISHRGGRGRDFDRSVSVR